MSIFRNKFSEDIFNYKYRHEGAETWEQLSRTLVNDVCDGLLPNDIQSDMVEMISKMKFIPGGRYLYYANRPYRAWNNCYLLKAEEDTREDWAELSWKSESCLSTGGGIGADYSIYRPKGSALSRTGGQASGPVSKMRMINEIGREVMQGGSRRSAIYASLNWQHADVHEFLTAKDWQHQLIPGTSISLWDAKQADFNFPAPLDMTNISLNYDDQWLNDPNRSGHPTFRQNCLQALSTGEPGFSFNFGSKQNETLRNAPVAGDTRVLTVDGYKSVLSIVGTKTKVWTGKQWAETTFRRTKRDTATITISMSNGNKITADPTHVFFVVTPNNIAGVTAATLRVGDKLHTSVPLGFARTEVYVDKIYPSFDQDVYCCDVGVEEHSFCAEGVIISNCTEVTSEDDSDVCNLGSLNLSRIQSLDDFKVCIELATLFLLCGTLRAHLPYNKVEKIREKNRRLGLGLMGIHEWLIQRNTRYEVSPELHEWLAAYQSISRQTADQWSKLFSLSRPVACRAIAPTGTIGILAGTSTGIEPVFAVAYKRRYLKNGTEWHYQFVIDSAAQTLIDLYGTDPSKIESAIDLATDYERRIKFQADVQDYVDMAISSTINLPAWGTPLNGLHSVGRFSDILSKYAPRLRGFTVYPDGARGGQPLTSVAYADAKSHVGTEFREHDVCSLTGGGVCGS